MGAIKTCLHCERERYIQGRGLCGTCHGKPEVRDRYAPSHHGRIGDWSEPTAEELDRMIAEQLTDLPAWWHAEERRKVAECRPPGPPKILLNLYASRGSR
jgi:hypothetical protein